MSLDLQTLGYNDAFAAQIRADEAAFTVGRVSFETRGIYHVLIDGGVTMHCELRGLMRKGARDHHAYPVVGDWILVDKQNEKRGLVVRALERKNALIRRETTRNNVDRRGQQLQVLAANVDWGFITSSLNEEWNPRRIERYLGLVRDGGVQPAILLTKADLMDDGGAEAAEATKAIAGNAPVLILSTPTGLGVDQVRRLIQPGDTAVFLGSSGVGKSTLVNALLGNDTMAVAEIREKDGRGRHTTVGRHLLALPEPLKACLIDSPGLRDLGLVDEKAVDAAYDDIVLLAETCKFSDCGHSNEPGCAVQAAIADGSLDAERYESYVKLRDETKAAEKRKELGAERFQREKGKEISKVINKFYKIRPGGKR
jgi:ribosome biogenesis GTPase